MGKRKEDADGCGDQHQVQEQPQALRQEEAVEREYTYLVFGCLEWEMNGKNQAGCQQTASHGPQQHGVETCNRRCAEPRQYEGTQRPQRKGKTTEP